MNKCGLLIAILALIFVPGSIPAFVITRTAKSKKKFATQHSEG